MASRRFRHGPGWSACHGWQADEGIIAQWGDGFQRHVSRPLDGPLIVLFEQAAPTSLMMASSFGKMPTISLRRLILPLTRSIGLVL